MRGKLRQAVFQVTVLVVAVVSLISGTCSAASKQTFAYIAFRDATVAQFRVDEKGEFHPLKPWLVTVGKLSAVGMVVDPLGRSAFCFTYGDRHYYKIGEDGRLVTPTNRESPEIIGPDGVVDKEGKFIYVISTVGDGTRVTQFGLRRDGSPYPLDPPVAIAKGADASRYMVTHPSKPYLYICSGLGLRSSFASIVQFRINKDGTLSALNPPTVDYDGIVGRMVISKDGKYLYTSCTSYRSIIWFRIKDDGSLKQVGSLPYEGYDLALDRGGGVEYCLENIFMSPCGKSIFVTDSLWGGMYKLDLDKYGKPHFDDSYWVTKDLKMLRDSRVHKEAKKEAKTKRAEREDEFRAEWRIWAEKTKEYDRPRLIANGPDGTIYCSSWEGISRFTIKPDGSIKDMEPAFRFPKGWRIKKPATETTNASVRSEERFFIVQRSVVSENRKK